MIVSVARGNGGQRIWYSRRCSPSGLKTREYHLFALHKVVSARRGTFWKFVIFRWCFVFRYRPHRNIDDWGGE